MTESRREERIGVFVDEFLGSTRFSASAFRAREWAEAAITAFLRAACEVRDVGPEEIEEGDIRPGLLDGVARIELPPEAREEVPDLVASFLAEMETSGRLSGGRRLGKYARALKASYLDAAAGRLRPHVSSAPKLGRNDPCPCGSGKKYKKCCLGR